MMNRVRYSFRFIFAILLAAVIGVVGRPAPASAQAPANDNIANAIYIGVGCEPQPGTVTGTNVKATTETGEPLVQQSAGFTIWYRWTAIDKGPTTMYAIGNPTGTPFTAEIGVYTDSANPATVAALKLVAGGTGEVNFIAMPFQTYYIQVDSAYGNVPGPIALSWSQLTNPSGLVATPGNTTVQLRWDAPTSPINGCTGTPTWMYDIYRNGRELAKNIPFSTPFYTDTLLTNGQSYTYTVYADDGVLQTPSNSVTVTPFLPAPTGVKAFPGEKQVSLQWNAVPHALTYNVKRSASSGGPYTTIANVTTNSYIDTPLTDGVTYYYVISAVDVSSESANSAQVSATPEPPGPSDLTASVNEGEVILNWSSTPGATSYNVKRGAVTGGPYSTISSGQTATTFTDNGVINGHTYFYVVTSNYSTGESPNSNEVEVDVPTLNAPQNLQAAGKNMEVDLSWNAAPGAASYSVKRGTTSGGPYGAVASGLTGTSFNDTGLTNGVTYYYVVTASNFGGQSPNSSQVSATPALPPPTALVATATSGKVTLNWTAPVGADSYNVKRGTTSGGPYVTLANVTAPSVTYVDKTVNNGTTYYYVVTAIFAGVESAPSNEASAEPLAPPPPPTIVGATAGDAQVTVTWRLEPPISAVTSYQVLRGTVSGGPYTVVGSTDNVTASFTDTGLTNGTTYYYVVTATNGGGVSGYSDEVSAMPVAPPAIPGNLTAQPGNAKVTLNWSTSPTAASYNVKRGTATGGPYTTIASVPAPTTTYVDTGVTNGSTYYYVVTAVNATNESQNSNEASATPVAPPTAPTNLTVNGGDGTADLSWTASPGADSYTVERSTASGAETPLETGLTGTTFNDNTVVNGTTYYYVVTATNAGGTSPASNEVKVTPQAPPPAPANVTATAGDMQVVLAWDAVTGATGYNVKRSTAAAGPFLPVASNVSGATYTDKGLTNGTTYYYVVSAVNNGIESANSSVVSATPEPPAPPAPTNLAATAGNGQVALTWTGSTGATSYTLLRGTVSGGPYSDVVATGLTGTSYTDTSVTNGVTYYYVVAGVNGGGQGASSNEAAATPLAPPAAPTNVKAVAGDTEVTLSWTASPDATGYNVYRGSVTGGPYTRVATGLSTTGYLDKGLTDGETYYYVVTATGVGGESVHSSEVTATPQIPAPAAPTRVTAQGGNAQVSLSWTASSGATGYNVKRAAVSGGPYTTVGTGVTGTSFVDTGLVNGTTYYYVVTAINAGGEGAASAEVSAVPGVLPTTPTNLTALAVSGSEIDLAWMDTASDADNFLIERMSAGSGFTQIGSVGGSARSFADTAIQPNVTYTYRVRATHAGVNSDYSNLATATAGIDSISGGVATNYNNTLLPLPGATVQLLNATGAAVLSSVLTDNNGHYSFTNLLDGTYTVKVVTPDPADSQSASVTVRLAVNNGIGTHDFIVNSLIIFPRGLSLVSLPYDYSNTNLNAATIFGLPVASDGSAMIAGFDPTTNQYGIYPSLPVSGTKTLPGVGYWILEPRATPFTQAGSLVSSPFDLTLNPGWNLIGDPFITPIDLGALQFQVGAGPVTTPVTFGDAITAGLIGDTVYGYSMTSGQYFAAANIQPFAGYWIYINPQAAMNQPVTVRFTQ